jgi:hypothetical protein
VAGCDQVGAEEGVEVFRVAIGTPPRRALPAFDLALPAFGRGSISADFGLHCRAKTTGQRGLDFGWNGVLLGRREPPRVRLAEAEAVPGRAG